MGIISLKNENNQDAVHLACIFGAKDCLIYLLKFEFLSADKEDKFIKTPIEYLIENHNEETEENKIMFVLLLIRSDIRKIKMGKINGKFNNWQNSLFYNFSQNRPIKIIA